MKLSVIVPIFNEINTIEQVINKLKELKLEIEKEIILIDDCSNDGTRQKLTNLGQDNNLKIFYHKKNQGKGAAVRTGLAKAEGEFLIIQDADLEYSVNDYPQLLKPLIKGKTRVVYGSRFLNKNSKFTFIYFLANKFLTFLTNLLYNSTLTDIETCYKVFRTEVLKRINLEANGFEIESEITAKLLKRGYQIYEVPIFYKARTRQEGKKIGFWDGLSAIFCLLKYKFKK